MGKISYALLNMDVASREETPLTAKTDRGARIQAKKLAKELAINKYLIVFFRDADHCRGSISI